MRNIVFIFLMLAFSFGINAQEKKPWTIMHYAAGSNSSEIDLMEDVKEMMQGKLDEDYELILLIDRIEGHSEDSTTLGANFSDTRLYRISHNNYEELDGKETLNELNPQSSYDANMGDAHFLQRFIQFCKKNYPAENYMLVLRSHGNGVGMCPDAEHGDRDKLYPAELTEVLTQEESVDILGLDVCSMAGLENLYQWRPNNGAFQAKYVIASAPLSGAWAYDKILERLQSKPTTKQTEENDHFNGGNEANFAPKELSPLNFANLILEETFDSQSWASWGVFDNSKIERLKQTMDDCAKLLANANHEELYQIMTSSLGYHHNTNNNEEIALLVFPYVDAYDFWKKVSVNHTFSNAIQNKAKEVCNALDALVVNSYYGKGFLPETNDFTDGKNGVYQIIPQGKRIFSQSQQSFWSHSNWFHPNDKSNAPNSYGKYSWCKDGATANNQKVENFFELLDAMFDGTKNTNDYHW